MYKFVCWLDEPGKRFLHVAIFQLCVMLALLAVFQAGFIFWLELASITAIVAVLTAAVERSARLVLGISALAVFEDIAALQFVFMEAAKLQPLAIFAVLVIGFGVNIQYGLFSIRQNRKWTDLLPPL